VVLCLCSFDMHRQTLPAHINNHLIAYVSVCIWMGKIPHFNNRLLMCFLGEAEEGGEQK
jgi:hypothetical protein